MIATSINMFREETIDEYILYLSREAEELNIATEEAAKNNMRQIEELCRSKRQLLVRMLKKLSRLTVRDLMIDEIIRGENEIL